MYVKDEQEWEVSEILRHKGSDGIRKYLVSYSGHKKSKACWLPESELCIDLEILNEYKVSHYLT